MKIHYIAILVLTSCLYLVASVGAADLEEGFMGYEWGDEIWNYAGLKQLYSKGGITFYANPGESYSIEGRIIGDVIYGFYEGKFYSVYINLRSLDTYDVVMNHMKEKYGLPDLKSSAKDQLSAYKWKYKEVTIKLKINEQKGHMKVAFYHGPTAEGLKKERMLLEIEASDRFFPIEKNDNINMVPFLESWNQR